MRIDCHIHTSRYSRCSRLSPDALGRLALERGLDAAVITEHHTLWSPEELQELEEEHPGIRFFTGLEITLEEGLDMVVIPTDTSFSWPHFPSFDNLLPRLDLHRDELFLFVAHPYRWMDVATREQEAIMAYCDGVEMNSVNIMKGGWRHDGSLFRADNAALYQEAGDRHSLIPLYNTDAHMDEAVGTVSNDLGEVAMPSSQEELVCLLKRSRPRERQHADALTECLKYFALPDY